MRLEQITRQNTGSAHKYSRVEGVARKTKRGIEYSKPIQVEIDACERMITRFVDGCSRDDEVVGKLFQHREHRTTHHGIGIENEEAFTNRSQEQFDLGEAKSTTIVRQGHR